MLQAVPDGFTGVPLPVGTIHRLQEEVAEGELLETGRFGTGLGEDEFEFVSLSNNQFSPRLGAHANPRDPGREGPGSVGFDGDREAVFLKGGDESTIQLQEGFSTGANHERMRKAGVGGGPGLGHSSRKVARREEVSSSGSVGAEKVRVAKPTNGTGAIFLATGPEVTPRETAEHSGTAHVGPFPLESVVDLLNAIGFHGKVRKVGGKAKESHS
jgi:hypothetical protein